MGKSLDVAVCETKNELLNLVNAKLDSGVPISVMDVIIEDIGQQIKNILIKTLVAEQKQTAPASVDQKIENVDNEDGATDENN